jgi:hydrophobic/amphiphilic exporter-1 (mainly G- bacteria), HAE1 family
LMTAIAALVGFFPLVVASGAGANSRHSLGTAVFGGLLVSTILSLLVVPVLYIVIKTLESRVGRRRKSKPPNPPSMDGSQNGAHPVDVNAQSGSEPFQSKLKE